MGQKKAKKQLDEKGPGFLLDSRLNISEQGVLVVVKINHINKSADCRSKEVTIAICVVFRRQHPEHCVWFWSPQRKRESEELDFIQGRVTNMISVLQHKACNEVER